MTAPIGKLLIANRGEIACRVIRSARRMGIAIVAVYSDADADALHVRMADEAVRLGPAPARDSYMRADLIVAAARHAGAQAIHPGYGFLSESADFAQACADAALIFVGPDAATMRLMGSKSAAKALMERSGVPLVPGYHGDAQDLSTMRAAANAIGYPVLVKASAGGGGRGMRVVRAPADLPGALEGAAREAAAAFGDPRLLLEKYIEAPRHIEVQVFGDSTGAIVSLMERECSLQRRHQKVIEEAPALSLEDATRATVAAYAREAARAARYVNAGTVEFIADDGRYYFIEMNTRLQVEHPVTEMITGLDLVEWQLRVAAGEPLPLRQDQIRARGHAIEARIYAEDADSGFLPSIGVLQSWRMPLEGPDLRVETGVRAGDAVTPHYDAMLAKLVAFGPTRAQALARLAAALGECAASGVATNIGFLERLLARPEVQAGVMDTGLIEREAVALTAPLPLAAGDLAAAAAAVAVRDRRPPSGDPWDDARGWTLMGERGRELSFRDRAGTTHTLTVTASALNATARGDDRVEYTSAAQRETALAAWSGRDLDLRTPRGRFRLHWIDPYAGAASAAGEDDRLVAPMPGIVTRILAAPGDMLARGTPVLVVEAMKMEHTLRAPADGTLEHLNCAVGDVVREGTILADFRPGPRPFG